MQFLKITVKWNQAIMSFLIKYIIIIKCRVYKTIKLLDNMHLLKSMNHPQQTIQILKTNYLKRRKITF